MFRSRLLWTPRKLGFHAFILCVVVVCSALGYWQLRRGEDGNPRSFGYALEWPFFAGAAIYMWWRTLRDELKGLTQQRPDSSAPDPAATLPASTVMRAPEDAEPDPELDAYNAYLADLDRAATAGSR